MIGFAAAAGPVLWIPFAVLLAAVAIALAGVLTDDDERPPGD